MATDERKTLPQPTAQNRLLSMRKAGEIIGLGPDMMRRLARDGELPAEKVDGSNEYVIREHALREWHDKRQARKKQAQAQ